MFEPAAYGCEVLFSKERSDALQKLIEGATGELCPCKQGRGCPLLPRRSNVAPIAAPAA